jgi:hypothetical protein
MMFISSRRYSTKADDTHLTGTIKKFFLGVGTLKWAVKIRQSSFFSPNGHFQIIYAKSAYRGILSGSPETIHHE